MTAFNEDSRLAAETISHAFGKIGWADIDKARVINDLKSRRQAVVPVDLVERLVAALATIREEGCCASMQHGEGHSQECDEELRLMLDDAKAAGFGGKA